MKEELLREKNLKLLDLFFSDASFKDFSVVLWDGTEWKPAGARSSQFVIKLNTPSVLAKLMMFPVDRRVGEAFIYGLIDIEGDMIKLCSLEDHIERRYRELIKSPAFWGLIFSLATSKDERKLRGREAAKLDGELHSIERDRQAISYHYDVSNEFFALWLDSLMNYSCAYFRTGKEDIDTAQRNKLELVCRKLRLRRGEKVLDIGCGWGGFLFYAAEKYGVQAHGITLSRNQYEYAKEKIKEKGLEGLVKVEYRDYRELEDWETYDKIVSIGMFEHVGKKMLEEYFRRAYRLLKPGGLFLNHGITRRLPKRLPRRWSFSDNYIFPDGELHSISYTLTVAEKVGFEVRDVENLREHYALTLRHWWQRLEKRREEARRYVDEVTLRTWRIFLSGSSYGFQVERFGLHQALLVKNRPGGENDLPLTREDIYLNWNILEEEDYEAQRKEGGNTG